MVKSFSKYLLEETKTVYFTFGRMNPPTIGHGKLLDKISSVSGREDYLVYLSQSHSAKKDPLTYEQKVKHARKMFPKHARQIIKDNNVKTVFDIAVKLYEDGYRQVVMVVGDDRVREFDILLNKYDGKKAKHGFYQFNSIKVISAGQRDPDAEGIEGMSASKQRAHAKNNDFMSFSQGVPKSMSNSDTRKLFNDVRSGMGLSQMKEFRSHLELEPVSETREKFVHGELFNVGDTVVVKESGEVTDVVMLGANYVITETNGVKTRRWLDAVELLEGAKQDPDIKDRKGTQPANYHKGLAKSTKAKRDAHFKKHGKKDDDDPSAYKPAPGDKDAKTKPSKYTKAFKDMYDEDCWDGYKQVGMKKKGKKMVPNCVKETGGAGEEGTDELKKKYEKDTPHMKVDERSWAHDLGKLASKTVKKDKYNKLAKHATDLMNKSKEKHSHVYWADKVLRMYNVSGINSRALADVMKGKK